ncbi:Sigma-24 [uncultured Eubacterium sp.]|nr:Sigma-24 [uncultured Eubacterium sp.]
MREGKKRKLFEAVIEPYYENVYRFILSQTNDQELAQDLTQNAFEKAWLKLEQLRDTEAALSWLLSIANSEKNLYFRAQNRNKRSLFKETLYDGTELELIDLESNVLELVLLKESKMEAIKALYQVEEKYREVVWLRIIEEMEYEKIAETLDMKEGTVRTRYRRGLICLREEYAKVIGGENCE